MRRVLLIPYSWSNHRLARNNLRMETTYAVYKNILVPVYLFAFLGRGNPMLFNEKVEMLYRSTVYSKQNENGFIIFKKMISVTNLCDWNTLGPLCALWARLIRKQSVQSDDCPFYAGFQEICLIETFWELKRDVRFISGHKFRSKCSRVRWNLIFRSPLSNGTKVKTFCIPQSQPLGRTSITQNMVH